ncbi:MAG: co-chaperone GroES [Vicinamibacteraceae bacterium]
MNIQPLHDRIVVQRVEEKEQQIGGIVIPDTAREKPQQARVVAVGPGRVNDKGARQPLGVKVDDFVLIGTYAGTEITVQGDDYVILREDEVLGVLEGVAEPVTA